MSADLLREAARVMRERAEAATPSPWETVTYDSGLSYRALNSIVVTTSHGDLVANVDYHGDAEGPHAEEGADAEHIASWHPAVTLAVADWLDEEARWLSVAKLSRRITTALALAVARAYLGRDS